MIEIDEIKNNKLFDDLTKEDIDLFLRVVRPKLVSVDNEQTLITMRKVENFFWIVLSGTLAEVKDSVDWDEYLIKLYRSNEIIAMDNVYQNEWTPDHRIVTKKKCELLAVNTNRIENEEMPEHMKNKIYENIDAILASEKKRERDRLMILLDKSIRNRIIMFLDIERKKMNRNKFNIGIDRELLAQYLGIHRTTLSRELSHLQNQGIISYHKDHFVIIDETASIWNKMD